MRNHTPPNRYPSLACSIALHAGLLAWAVWPHAAAEMPPQPQMVDISVVMLSSLAPEVTTAEPAQPPAPEKSTALQVPAPPPKHALKKAESKHEQKPEQKVASKPPTTGLQSPNATEKVAATEPIFNAASLNNTPPAYPADARRKGIEGEVMLEVEVTPEGAAREVAVAHSSGYALLDKAAREAISHWRFIPAKHDGELVAAKIEVPVEFRLE